MNKKRDSLQVIYDILNVIREKNGNIKPTHILYKSNLSHSMMDEYLKDLVAKNFISEIKTKNGKTYSLKDKGYEFLEKYKTIINLLESFGLR